MPWSNMFLCNGKQRWTPRDQARVLNFISAARLDAPGDSTFLPNPINKKITLWENVTEIRSTLDLHLTHLIYNK